MTYRLTHNGTTTQHDTTRDVAAHIQSAKDAEFPKNVQGNSRTVQLLMVELITVGSYEWYGESYTLTETQPETATARTAEFSAHNAVCSCGQRHALMAGQVSITCECGAQYGRPELGYRETATVHAWQAVQSYRV